MLGLCGGYQMLGRRIADPEGIEGTAGDTPGLGLLEVDTVMRPEKRVTLTRAVHAATGRPIEGYEIHLGVTDGPDCARPFARIGGRPEGAVAPSGRIAGTYMHGLFASDGFRAAYLAGLGIASDGHSHAAMVEATLDALALHLEQHLDVGGMLALARQSPSIG